MAVAVTRATAATTAAVATETSPVRPWLPASPAPPQKAQCGSVLAILIGPQRPAMRRTATAAAAPVFRGMWRGKGGKEGGRERKKGTEEKGCTRLLGHLDRRGLRSRRGDGGGGRSPQLTMARKAAVQRRLSSSRADVVEGRGRRIGHAPLRRHCQAPPQPTQPLCSRLLGYHGPQLSLTKPLTRLTLHVTSRRRKGGCHLPGRMCCVCTLSMFFPRVTSGADGE